MEFQKTPKSSFIRAIFLVSANYHSQGTFSPYNDVDHEKSVTKQRENDLDEILQNIGHGIQFSCARSQKQSRLECTFTPAYTLYICNIFYYSQSGGKKLSK